VNGFLQRVYRLGLRILLNINDDMEAATSNVTDSGVMFGIRVAIRSEQVAGNPQIVLEPLVMDLGELGSRSSDNFWQRP
jgi:hypothetical protein